MYEAISCMLTDTRESLNPACYLLATWLGPLSSVIPKGNKNMLVTARLCLTKGSSPLFWLVLSAYSR